MKTILQVEGADGLQKLQAKIRKGGPGVLYAGSAGAMSATFVGHYPWFYTNNYLNSVIPKYDRTENLPMFLARNAFVGFCSSAVSDTCAPLRRARPTPERADARRARGAHPSHDTSRGGGTYAEGEEICDHLTAAKPEVVRMHKFQLPEHMHKY
mgnify:CR=1 FL=1